MRRIPSTLVVAVAARLILEVVALCVNHAYEPELAVAGSGVALAYDVLVLVGMLEVAGRLEGRMAIAAQLVWAAAGVSIAFDGLRVVVAFGASPATVSGVETIWSTCVWPLVHVPIAVMVWRKHQVLAFVSFVASVFVVTHSFTAMQFASNEWELVEGAKVVAGIALVGLVSTLPQSEPVSLRTTASKAMRSTTRVAVMWTIGAVVLQMLAMMRLYELGAIRMSAVTYAFSYAICLGVLGYALARAASELSRWTAAIAAALMLSCAGVLAAQLPWIYRMYWNTSSWSDVRPEPYATAFTNVVPLAIMFACALFSLSVAVLGSRHGDKDLVTEARGRGIAIVLMFLASQRAVIWLAPKIESSATYVGLLAAAAVVNTLAAYQFARLWDSAGRALAEPGLPAARVVSEP